MDFIEQLFGISPDGGDGTAELIWILAFVGIAALVAVRWMKARRAAAQHR